MSKIGVGDSNLLDDMSSDDDGDGGEHTATVPTPCYQSCIRIKGRPILPPVMTAELREECRAWRTAAVLQEERMRARTAAKNAGMKCGNNITNCNSRGITSSTVVAAVNDTAPAAVSDRLDRWRVEESTATQSCPQLQLLDVHCDSSPSLDSHWQLSDSDLEPKSFAEVHSLLKSQTSTDSPHLPQPTQLTRPNASCTVQLGLDALLHVPYEPMMYSDIKAPKKESVQSHVQNIYDSLASLNTVIENPNAQPSPTSSTSSHLSELASATNEGASKSPPFSPHSVSSMSTPRPVSPTTQPSTVCRQSPSNFLPTADENKENVAETCELVRPRRGSYTLEKPSPLLQAHLHKFGAEEDDLSLHDMSNYQRTPSPVKSSRAGKLRRNQPPNTLPFDTDRKQETLADYLKSLGQTARSGLRTATESASAIQDGRGYGGQSRNYNQSAASVGRLANSTSTILTANEKVSSNHTPIKNIVEQAILNSQSKQPSVSPSSQVTSPTTTVAPLSPHRVTAIHSPSVQKQLASAQPADLALLSPKSNTNNPAKSSDSEIHVSTSVVSSTTSHQLHLSAQSPPVKTTNSTTDQVQIRLPRHCNPSITIDPSDLPALSFPASITRPSSPELSLQQVPLIEEDSVPLSTSSNHRQHQSVSEQSASLQLERAVSSLADTHRESLTRLLRKQEEERDLLRREFEEKQQQLMQQILRTFPSLKIDQLPVSPGAGEDDFVDRNTAVADGILEQSSLLASEIPSEVNNPKYARGWLALTALARGYLVRRLVNTEKVQFLKRTIRETIACAVRLHLDIDGAPSEQDVYLHSRLLAQLEAACHSIHQIFFELPCKERMSIIALDRAAAKSKQMIKHKFNQPNQVGKKISAATRSRLEKKARDSCGSPSSASHHTRLVKRRRISRSASRDVGHKPSRTRHSSRDQSLLLRREEARSLLNLRSIELASRTHPKSGKQTKKNLSKRPAWK